MFTTLLYILGLAVLLAAAHVLACILEGRVCRMCNSRYRRCRSASPSSLQGRPQTYNKTT